MLFLWDRTTFQQSFSSFPSFDFLRCCHEKCSRYAHFIASGNNFVRGAAVIPKPVDGLFVNVLI